MVERKVDAASAMLEDGIFGRADWLKDPRHMDVAVMKAGRPVGSRLGAAATPEEILRMNMTGGRRETVSGGHPASLDYCISAILGT